MNALKKASVWLLVIGGLNWLILGIFNWEIGHLFGGMDAAISRIIYVIVGLSALVYLFAPRGAKRGVQSSPAPSGDMGGQQGGM